MLPHLLQRMQEAPTKPGVYRFLDAKNKALYVGKAKNIQKRLQNHLTNPAFKLAHMLEKAQTIEWQITQTEQQALFLEAETIEYLKPPYNIQYRYGKRYNYLHLSKSDFPRLYASYIWSDKAYGPFERANHTLSMRQITETACKIFKLRTCSDAVFKNRKRPCMEYELGRCSAPCVNYITKQDYQKSIKKFDNFFNNPSTNLTKKLSTELEEAIAENNFELADLQYKQIQAIETLTQFVPEELEIAEADFFIITTHNQSKCIHTCGIRERKLKFKTITICEDEKLEEFILRWKVHHKLAQQLFVNEQFSADLEKILGKNIEIYRFQYPKINAIIEQILAINTETLTKYGQERKILQELQQIIGLQSDINVIETYDNSHMQGKWNVGVKVVWEIGTGFIRSQFRIFKHETRTNDDYQMMRDMFQKRFATSKDKWPDLVLIDGGMGQLGAGSPIIPVPHVALSKHVDGDKLHTLQGEKEVTQALRLFLMKLRDEAHRFAVQSHTKAKLAGMLTKDESRSG